MELTPTTIEHLRDEAYAFLGREVIEKGLQAFERRPEEVSGPRSPFGQPRGHAGLESSTHAAGDTVDSETRLRHRLRQLSQINRQLQSLLHPELESYLAAASAEYARFLHAQEQLDQWEIRFRLLPEKLAALAHDVERVRHEAGAGTGYRDLNLFASLRSTALSVEQHLAQLEAAGQALAASAIPGGENCVAALPDFRLVGWVNRIFPLPTTRFVAEVTRVETEIRTFLASDQAEILNSLRDSRAACQRATEDYLQAYWNQLRIHAQVYYVEDRQLGEVIEELVRRYAAPDHAPTGFAKANGQLAA